MATGGGPMRRPFRGIAGFGRIGVGRGVQFVPRFAVEAVRRHERHHQQDGSERHQHDGRDVHGSIVARAAGRGGSGSRRAAVTLSALRR